MWLGVVAIAIFALGAAWSGAPLIPRRKKDLPTALPPVDQALVADLAAAALASGASVPSVLSALGHALAEEEEDAGLEVAARSLAMGATWESAWAGVPIRFTPLRGALEPSWVDGAAAIPLLERTAAALRASRVRRTREAAARLGARLVLPLGLCFLPAFLVLGVVPVVLSAGVSLLD